MNGGQAHPQRKPWQSFLNCLWGFFSILKEGTTGPAFLPSPQPHPVFRENEFEERKTRDRKRFPKLGRAARLGPSLHPQPTCHLAPPISDHLLTAPHAWH